VVEIKEAMKWILGYKLRSLLGINFSREARPCPNWFLMHLGGVTARPQLFLGWSCTVAISCGCQA